MSLIKWTGNPFVDCGIAATLSYCQKDSPNEISIDDLHKMKDFLLSVYVETPWRKSFSRIFTNNCKLLQNSFGNDENRNREYLKLLNTLLADESELNDKGNCIACGQRNAKRKTKKDGLPLIGSGGSQGFFPNATNGIDFCDYCSFMTQCSPLTFFSCYYFYEGEIQSGFLLVHSNSIEVLKLWGEKSTSKVEEQFLKRSFIGCWNENYGNPQNALFSIASKIIRGSKRIRMNDIKPNISLYHFSSGLRPKETYLKLYELPFNVFNFILKTELETYRTEWEQIVLKGYIKQKSENDENDNKSPSEKLKNVRNKVYQDLLDGKPIITRFFNSWERKVYCDFALLKIYLQEVLFMEEKRIERIKNLADEIAIFVQQSEKGEKRFKELERATQFRFFCSTLLKISKERLELNPEKPLLTLDIFVRELSSDLPFGFTQVRYIILFRLYEQLHDWLKERKGFSDEADDINEPTKIETIENNEGDDDEE